jgi:hypothetical protein
MAGLGSLEFTQFFNHSRLWKLQHIRVSFTMTVGAQK